jgi:ABC-type Fe3+/spermidine/putrescine transport system ATPase subunit
MIEIKGVGKSFGKTRVLEDIDLRVEPGEFFCLLGPSGCGKTTLLRLIAGLEKPDGGSIRIGGKDMAGEPPHRRGCAMVFQNYALWPHLSVGENIVYGLEVQGRPKAEIENKLGEMLKAYQLEGLRHRMPHQLSGGQQQRVALARAMAVGPAALLMDEPLSNLDAALRKTLRRDLLDFHRSAGNTIVYVTHDQEEALALSDRIALLMNGRLVETGKPLELYARPRHLETALFLGDINVFRGAAASRFKEGPGGETLCIRPENVVVGSGDLPATLRFTESMGTHATLGLDTEAGRVLARVAPERAETARAGDKLMLDFPREHRLWY